MDLGKKPLAIGTEDFEKLRRRGYYYVDKTGLIADLLRGSGEVNLFTRPRRFGKTLNMSMLKCFFEIGGDPSLFEGLEITGDRELCERYMNRYPVIFVSLKDIGAGDYETARKLAAVAIVREALRLQFLIDSSRLSEYDRISFQKLLDADMEEADICSGLRILSDLLEKHYGHKVILLIDEYDVPLQKAYYGGYYDQMVQLLRGMFSQALKTNTSLEFAVLTGCLRIAKESVFTGMNNLKVFSIADTSFDEYFGFTDREVQKLMGYYELDDFYGKAREWYDGYHFGESDVYCPWDVVNYCYNLRADPQALPENFWANSSGNDAVTEFVNKLDVSVTARELEELVAGEPVWKEIRQELTYREMYSTVENLWSLLYMTGYLTGRRKADGRMFQLTIPNMEIRDIFRTQILDLFRDRVAEDGAAVREFCSALQQGNAARVEELFEQYLKKTVSIRDTFAHQSLKENFYHGLLLGILGFKGNWYVTSNYETGDGYGDILIETENDSLGIVIEVKYARNGNLENEVKKALKQIEDKHYAAKLYDDGIGKVLKYGVACYKKRCKVALTEG